MLLSHRHQNVNWERREGALRGWTEIRDSRLTHDFMHLHTHAHVCTHIHLYTRAHEYIHMCMYLCTCMYRLGRWCSGKASTCRFQLWGGKIPWRRKRQPILVFLPGKSHGQRRMLTRMDRLQSMGPQKSRTRLDD